MKKLLSVLSYGVILCVTGGVIFSLLSTPVLAHTRKQCSWTVVITGRCSIDRSHQQWHKEQERKKEQERRERESYRNAQEQEHNDPLRNLRTRLERSRISENKGKTANSVYEDSKTVGNLIRHVGCALRGKRC